MVFCINLRLPHFLYNNHSEPRRPVAPPSPDYIPIPKEPQTPPVPQDEDKHDEHVFPAEEQPLPLVVSPTTESPGCVAESDPVEDPEEYEDDVSDPEDGPVDYPMEGGYEGNDDDGYSFEDDADDGDAEDEDEEEEDHLAPTDSDVVVPLLSLFPHLREQSLLHHHPPLTLLPLELGLLYGFRLPYPFHQRCTTPSTHSSPLPVPSPLLPSSGCSTQIQTLRLASTQALIDAVTAALPSPPLPPSLYVPPPVDRKDDIPESELPLRKRSCLSTLGLRYEVEESSTARPTRGRGIDYGFVSIVDAEARRWGIREVGYGIRDTWVDPAEAVSKIAPMTVGEVNTRVTELAELHEHDTHDLYALLEDA
ncbi:hypothetical protein Tco_1185131 [Tanacetum coccineum]